MTTSQYWLPLLVCNQILWRQVFYAPPPPIWGLEMGCTQHESVQKGLISSLTLEHTDLKSMCLGGSEMVPGALEEEEGRQSGEITRGTLQEACGDKCFT